MHSGAHVRMQAMRSCAPEQRGYCAAAHQWMSPGANAIRCTGLMRTAELEGMRSVAPACLSECLVVHMYACKLYDHALRGNVDTAPRRTGVDEPRR